MHRAIGAPMVVGATSPHGRRANYGASNARGQTPKKGERGVQSLPAQSPGKAVSWAGGGEGFIQHPPSAKPKRVLRRAETLLADMFRHIEENRLRAVELFFTVDMDGSGEMDRVEFETALELMGIIMPSSDIDLAFEELDEDSGGTIEIEEFMARMRREQRWRAEDAAAEAAQDGDAIWDEAVERARAIEAMPFGDEKDAAIRAESARAWDAALGRVSDLEKMRMQDALDMWNKADMGKDEDYLAMEKKEAEARLAEEEHAKEEEEAQAAVKY